MIFIRADANLHIGSGHLMRCLTIAEELKSLGEEVTFLLSDEASAKQMEQKGFSYLVLHTQWDMLDNEITLMKEYIKQYRIEKLLVDSYYISKEALSELSRHTKVMYFDDLSKEIIDVQGIIHYGFVYNNEFYRRYGELKGKKLLFNDTLLLLGSKYIPLRKEFSNVISDDEIRENNILITTGGCDTYNVTGKLMEMIASDRQYDRYHYHIIVGLYNENKDKLIEMASGISNITIYHNISNVAQIMMKCRVAISAGGSSLYELCAMGTPTVCFSFADNQELGVQTLEALKLVRYAGDVRYDMESCVTKLMKNVGIINNNIEIRNEMTEKIQCMIDGKGAYRIAQALISEL